MKTQVSRLLLSSLFCLALLAAFSTSSAQAPASPVPPAGSPGPRIRLAAGEFDPLVDPDPARLAGDLRLSAYGGDGTGYYLVQFGGPIAAADVDALVAAGAEVLDYIPDFTFIVNMDGATRRAVAGMRQVRWVGLYQPAYRLSADLLAKTSGSVPIADFSRPSASDRRQVADLRTPWRNDPVEVVVTVFRGEALVPIIAQVEDMGGVVLDRSQTEWKSKLKVSIPPSGIAGIAAISGVRWIEQAPEWRLANSEAADIMGVREVWDTHGLYGDGQMIAVCDTGIDRGSAPPGLLHDDFEDGAGGSRVVAIHDRVGDGADDVNSGHGTHVAGSVLGNGDLSGATPAARTYPDTAYAGMAPEASLVFQAVEHNASRDLSGIPLDLNILFAEAAGSGADLHTNSWGASAVGMYTGDSEDVDEYVWDHKDFTILFAAGNGGVDSDADGVIDLYSIDIPGTAKNCITVGATENDRPHGSTPPPGYDTAWGTGSWAVTYPSLPVSSDHVSDDPAGMAAFSSRGPALDGRFKPDLVAPGTNIASVRSAVASSSGWGPIDSNYMFMGGTSMATPLVAGAATIVRQYYTDEENIVPSAALIKAALVNGATDIYPGQYGIGGGQEISDTRPTNVAGWGRVNLEGSMFPPPPRIMTYTQSAIGLTTGQSDMHLYTVASDAEPLRLTLAWSDYPGSPAAAGGLVNDLDLTVTGPGGTMYYPNNASQRGASQHLAYDDGGYNGSYYASVGDRVAVRFTPTSYPVTLQTGLFYVASRSDTYPKTFNWYVYDGNATSGPNAVLASGSTTIRRVAIYGEGWHAVDLSGAGITILSGDFFLAIELPDDDLVWFYDTTPPVDGRSWGKAEASWFNDTSADFMFNAIVKRADDSTNQDRVNNLVGIDIESPTAGVYTVTVSGYNVPQGPQPYALVASGDILDPPTISGLPHQLVDVGTGKDNVVDLWAYASDRKDADADLTFAIVNSPVVSAGITLDANRYIDINPFIGYSGTTQVVVQVKDTDNLTDSAAFPVTVIQLSKIYLPLVLRN